ncbi:MAG: hypothetical protein A3F78_22510 [Burkholderiales bacterium RIFCSPLOWO2_12_FULL_61_40]|nr:MAG: hypothetical protein A3F78_22510 [Burkholderiales bacterium RIFCSPLOWO2_12_FULL_61_40]
MHKTLWTALLVTMLGIAGGVWWLYSALDTVVASAIRTYGPEITGVSVQLESVKILPTDGTATLQGLEIGNPPGFHTARALSMGEVSMELDVASLTKDLVHVKRLWIEQPEITYEYASNGSNLDVILRHVQAYIAEKSGAQNNLKERKLVIDHLYIKGARAQVRAEGLQGKTLSVPVPDLHLTDIGKKSKGVSPAEATRQVLGALIQSVGKAVAPLHFK